MPAAQKIAAEKGIDTSKVQGTGRDGRVTKADVLEVKTQRAPLQQPTPPVNVEELVSGRPEQRVPMSRLRQRVAERLVQSQSTAAILTTFNEVNMAPVIEMRKRYQERFEKEHGVRLGFMSFFVKAAVHALKRFPMVNASIDGTDIVYHGYFDVGIAVGSPRGLVVPIVRDADRMSFAEIEKKIGDFGKRAQDGKLSIEELTGGTFSISNGGVFGSMLSTPIINPPQSAILGVHATKDRAVVENGQVVVRPMNYLALSYDHRIIDGREAVLFLVASKRLWRIRPPHPGDLMSVADEIAKLHELHVRGAISQAEFERAKASLLDAAPGPGARLAINRLRRSHRDRWIGGVCGGLGRLTGVAAWIWRAVFVLGLVIGGFTLFAYVVLWIFVPNEEL